MSEVTKNNSIRLNTKEAARYIGLAEQSLRNMIHLRRGPSYIKIGRRVLYDVKDLDQFIDSHRVTLNDRGI